jgi:NAD(P)-dependent dehydrogenase (short-subunit alcohol dehydrogenase family)
MSEPKRDVVLITGASSGIGKACAEHLAQRGYQVFGTSRRAPFPPEPANPGEPVMIRLDVDDDASVAQVVDYLHQSVGHLDVVVNNAGFGVAGAVEDTTLAEARAQMETNFFGLVRVCRAVLPRMRERGEGLVVNVSSLGGVIALPFQAFYSASKFAVEGFTEALRMEVKPFGIRVVLIEPGDLSTGFTSGRYVCEGAGSDSAYATAFEHMLETVEADERNGASPELVAPLLERIVRHPRPRPRYRVGSTMQKAAAALRGVLPDRVFEWLFMKVYGLA